MQFKIFKNKNIIQGISERKFGSMIGKKAKNNAVNFLKSIGLKNNFKNIVWAEQVFGKKVHICQKKDSGKIIKNVDGLLSNVPGQILVIVSADCLPILLYDSKKKIIGALHGSRKSLISGIIKEAIRKMILNFNSQPKEILVAIGPHIRKCHYEMDLTKMAIDDFLKLGIKRKNIEDCQICTFCSFKNYFSYRKQKENPQTYYEKKPRFASFIGIKTKRREG